MTISTRPTIVHLASLLLALAPLSCGSADDTTAGPAGGTSAGGGGGHGGSGGSGGSGGTPVGGGGTGGGGGAGGTGGAPWPIPAGCIDYLPPEMFDTSHDCTSIPSIDRVFDIEPLRWKGGDYLVVNEGNEFKIWNVDQPEDPQVVGWSTYFNVPNVGDSDYDLFDIALCDDCRFGAVTYKANVVELFDLGAGPQPIVDDHERYANVIGDGNVMFLHGGQQYMLGADLRDECGGDLAALYRIDGILSADVPLIECVPKPPGVIASFISGGQRVPGSAASYIYATGQFNKLHIFQIQDVASSITLAHVGPSTPQWASMGRSDSFAIDLRVQPPLAVRAVGNSVIDALTVYELSDPANPVELSTVPLEVTSAALWYPFVWASSAFGDTYTFDISDPAAPVPLDQDLWDSGHPHNANACSRSLDAVFHPSGSMLYLARYSVMQKFTVCGPPGGW